MVVSAAVLAASAGIAAAQQGALPAALLAGSLSVDDEAGPSSSAVGHTGSAPKGVAKTYLTLFGKEEASKAAEVANSTGDDSQSGVSAKHIWMHPSSATRNSV